MPPWVLNDGTPPSIHEIGEVAGASQNQRRSRIELRPSTSRRPRRTTLLLVSQEKGTLQPTERGPRKDFELLSYLDQPRFLSVQAGLSALSPLWGLSHQSLSQRPPRRPRAES